MSAACVVVVVVGVVCGVGVGGGGGVGYELRNLKWRKGRWRKKVRRRQPYQIAEHKNLRGLGEGYVRSAEVTGSLPSQIKHSLACCGCFLPFTVETLW